MSAPDVSVLSCAAVGPAAVDVCGFLAGAKISAFAAIPTAVDVPSAVTVSNIPGVPADAASVPALVLLTEPSSIE